MVIAFSLFSPGFAVAGVLLAALPIAIHLLNRRRYKIVEWAAMDFLLRAMKRNRKRLRFEQWLLLATRCAVLGLLGLALSQVRSAAAIRRWPTPAGAAACTCSSSTTATRWLTPAPAVSRISKRPNNAALRAIDTMDAGGESVAVITAGRPAKALLPEPTFDLQQAHSAVDRLHQTYGSTDLAGALRLAIDLGRRNNRQPNKTVYLLTDATRSAWVTSQAGELKSLGTDLAANFHVVLNDLSARGQWTPAVLDVRPVSNVLTTRPGFASDFEATAASFGRKIDAPLQWTVDGNVVPGAPVVHLDAQTPPQVQSQIVFKTGGPHVVTVSLPGDDPLRFENARSRVVNVLTDLKTLIVEGQHTAGPLGGPAAFLSLALDPPSSAAPSDSPTGAQGSTRGDGFVLPEVVSDLELGNHVLGDYRTVVLCNVGQVSASTAEQLQAFVKAGGTLVMFMGDSVDGDNYNRQLLSRGLLPGPLAKRVSAPAD